MMHPRRGVSTTTTIIGHRRTGRGRLIVRPTTNHTTTVTTRFSPPAAPPPSPSQTPTRLNSRSQSSQPDGKRFFHSRERDQLNDGGFSRDRELLLRPRGRLQFHVSWIARGRSRTEILIFELVSTFKVISEFYTCTYRRDLTR